jgi:UPF0755 protein
MSPRFGRGGGGEAERRERSAEERERARLEREARRARREGRAAPEVPAGPAVPAAPVDEPIAGPAPIPHPRYQEPAPEPAAEEAAPADVPQPAPGARPAPRPRPAPAPEPDPQADERVGEPAFAHQRAGHWAEPAPAAQEPEMRREPAPTVRVIGADEEPLGTKRVAASAMASAAGAEGPPRFGAPPKGRSRGPRRARRVILGLLVLIPLLALAWVANAIWQPFKDDASAGAAVRVTIPSGAGTGDIGDLLARKGIVDSGFFFQLRARLDGAGGKLRSGGITLHKDMTYAAALKALTAKGAGAVATTDVTVPEGRSIAEEAVALRKLGLRGDYARATRRSTVLDPRDYGAPKSITSREGFLWPATYELKKGATAATLVADQLAAFKENFGRIDLRRARARKLSRYDVLIIASMVEREAEVPRDRRLIASVIYNRLQRHIPLGIDATLRYRLNNWTRPLKVSELATPSAYNTRRSQGLPPTPIGNPGLASLQAAARPADTSYLYYVVKPCGDGAHAFSRTATQFQRDVAAYDRKRAQLGGKDPSHCSK